MRLPQEDFCLPPHLKYESDGGPGLRDLASVLKGSLRAEQDLTNLLITQLLFWMLAAPDGHAKNFSIRVLPQGRYQLTPLNDVMSIWPVEGKRPNQFSRFRSKMAMAVLGKNRHYLFKDIQRPHFNDIAGKYFDRVDAEELIGRVSETVPIAIEVMQRKIPEGFPDRISESVFKGLRESTEFLKRVSKT